MPGALRDRVALVIGAGSVAPGWGIGKAVAVAFARAGARVAVADLAAEAARETADIIEAEGHSARAAAVDATDEAGVRALVAETVDRWGRLDVLYNNVGVGKAGDPAETTLEDWRRISDANLAALHIAAQAVIPQMKRQGGGVILATSSIAGLRHVGFPHLAYGATKAAANHFARLMAVDYAADNIRVNTIVPGLLDTPRIQRTVAGEYGDPEEMRERRNRQVPLGFMGDAWDVANAAVFLASDQARYITGAELVVDGGITATTRG